ncbi:MAG: zinc-ribbon domain-containing protein [Eubacteriales bacterium]|nr:zinc-ribbon domain-containing protein [Eubacteriales bacterium]
MFCTECGALNDDTQEFCSVCGTPLVRVDPEARAAAEKRAAQPQPAPQENDPARPSWGFVRSPQWPTPNFDMNSVEDFVPEEVPDYQPAHNSAYVPAEPVPPVEQAYYPPVQQSYTAPQPPYAPAEEYDARFVPQQQDAAWEQPVQPVQPIGTVGDYDEELPRAGFGRAPQRAAVYSTEDERDVPFEAHKPRRSAAPARTKSFDDSFGSTRKPARSRSSLGRGVDQKKLIFIGVAALLVILILVFGVILINKNYGTVGNFFSSVFGGSPVLKDPTIVEGTMKGDIPCYSVTVYAKAGNVVRAKVGDKQMEGIIGKTNEMVVNIPKTSLLPAEAVDGDTAEITPDIRLFTEEGEEIELKMPAVTVQVPALSFAVTSPETTSLSVSNGTVAFAGTADVGTAVFVNGQQIATSEDGSFAGEYTVPDLGVYDLALEAKKAGYQVAKASYHVDYTVSEANITFENTTLRATEEAATTTVKGTTDAGASMTATADAGAEVSAINVAADGSFSFVVTMEKVGHYNVELTVTKSGVSSTKTVVVERAPKVDEYQTHKFDYDRMVKETKHVASYECIGKIDEILHPYSDAEPYVYAKMTVDGNQLVFEYRNAKYAANLQADTKKKVCADYNGIHEETGLPLVYAWFIYDSS